MNRTFAACPLDWVCAAGLVVGAAAGWLVGDAPALVDDAGVGDADVAAAGAGVDGDAAPDDADGDDGPQAASKADATRAAAPSLSNKRRDSGTRLVAGMNTSPFRLFRLLHQHERKMDALYFSNRIESIDYEI